MVVVGQGIAGVVKGSLRVIAGGVGVVVVSRVGGVGGWGFGVSFAMGLGVPSIIGGSSGVTHATERGTEGGETVLAVVSVPLSLPDACGAVGLGGCGGVAEIAHSCRGGVGRGVSGVVTGAAIGFAGAAVCLLH